MGSSTPSSRRPRRSRCTSARASRPATRCAGRSTPPRATCRSPSTRGAKLSVRWQDDDGARVLVEGPITGQHLRLEHGGGDSWLEAIGADVSVEMDRQVRSQLWADQTDDDVVSAILGTYGITADVEA